MAAARVRRRARPRPRPRGTQASGRKNVLARRTPRGAAGRGSERLRAPPRADQAGPRRGRDRARAGTCGAASADNLALFPQLTGPDESFRLTVGGPSGATVLPIGTGTGWSARRAYAPPDDPRRTVTLLNS